MNIQEQFDLIAEEYDANRRKFIPCFDDYYISTTAFIAANIQKPERILDLGAGTGLLSYYWYQHFPDTSYVLVDIAGEMLKIAGRRFDGLDNVSCRVMDYTNEFPEGDFDVIISALSIHHLENDEKQILFRRIYEKLPEGGLFVNYDQFCAVTSKKDNNASDIPQNISASACEIRAEALDSAGQADIIDRWFDTYWENAILHSGLTENDIALWKERRKLDRECSLEDELQMLRSCGFKAVNCVYSCRKFSVIAAVK